MNLKKLLTYKITIPPRIMRNLYLVPVGMCLFVVGNAVYTRHKTRLVIPQRDIDDPKVLRYPSISPNLEVRFKNHLQIQYLCRYGPYGDYDDPGTSDSGDPVSEEDYIIGCYTHKYNRIYVDVAQPCVIYHELCHAAGNSDEFCDQVNVTCSGTIYSVQYSSGNYTSYLHQKEYKSGEIEFTTTVSTQNIVWENYGSGNN